MQTPSSSISPPSGGLAPASYFAMTLGLAETGTAWRMGVPLWGLPTWPGEVLEILAALSFVYWLALFGYKWLAYRSQAKQEFRDPVQSAFLALIPESIILMAIAALPYGRQVAEVIFWTGSALNLAYGAFRLSRLWSEAREPQQSVPPLFLTFTASVLVNAVAAGLFGYGDYGWALFGIGGISWLILDSVLAQQLISGMLAVKTRNFMGIYMAPAVVAAVAYQVLSGGEAASSVVLALLGYATFLSVALLLAVKWLGEQAFVPGYWAYTFGVATLAQGLILAAIRLQTPALLMLAAVAFIGSLVLTALVAIGSVRLALRGKYFPPAPVVPSAP